MKLIKNIILLPITIFVYLGVIMFGLFLLFWNWLWEDKNEME